MVMTGFFSGSSRNRTLVCVLAAGFCLCSRVQAQLPFMNAGPDSAFAQIDFAQLYMDGSSRVQKNNAEQKEARQRLVDGGTVSALDLEAPDKALDEYNRAATMMKEQNAKQAIVTCRRRLRRIRNSCSPTTRSA